MALMCRAARLIALALCGSPCASPAEARSAPTRLKEWRRGEFVEYVKNPSYFVPGRPYLDGLRYVVIA